MSRTIIVQKPELQIKDALKRFSLNLNIKRFITDANGAILNDAAIPAALKKPYPFHLFSHYDKVGGYAIGDSIMSVLNRTLLFGYYVWGIGTPLFFFNPGATINNEMKKGDVIFIYVDDLNNPNYFIFVIVQAINGGYASFIDQSNISQVDNKGYWGVFKIRNTKFTWYDDAQLRESFYLINTRFDGAFKYDPLSPAAYYAPEQKTQIKTANIPLEFILNQYFGISSCIAYENPLINLSFELYA